MLAAYTDTEKQNNCFMLLGAHSLLGSSKTNNNPTISLLSSPTATEGYDLCSFYSGPSDSTIVAFCESTEGVAQVAYADSCESCGSIAYSGAGESCGSIASSSVSTGSNCSYSC